MQYLNASAQLWCETTAGPFSKVVSLSTPHHKPRSSIFRCDLPHVRMISFVAEFYFLERNGEWACARSITEMLASHQYWDNYVREGTYIGKCSWKLKISKFNFDLIITHVVCFLIYCRLQAQMLPQSQSEAPPCSHFHLNNGINTGRTAYNW